MEKKEHNEIKDVDKIKTLNDYNLDEIGNKIFDSIDKNYWEQKYWIDPISSSRSISVYKESSTFINKYLINFIKFLLKKPKENKMKDNFYKANINKKFWINLFMIIFWNLIIYLMYYLVLSINEVIDKRIINTNNINLTISSCKIIIKDNLVKNSLTTLLFINSLNYYDILYFKWSDYISNNSEKNEFNLNLGESKLNKNCIVFIILPMNHKLNNLTIDCKDNCSISEIKSNTNYLNINNLIIKGANVNLEINNLKFNKIDINTKSLLFKAKKLIKLNNISDINIKSNQLFFYINTNNKTKLYYENLNDMNYCFQGNNLIFNHRCSDSNIDFLEKIFFNKFLFNKKNIKYCKFNVLFDSSQNNFDMKINLFYINGEIKIKYINNNNDAKQIYKFNYNEKINLSPIFNSYFEDFISNYNHLSNIFLVIKIKNMESNNLWLLVNKDYYNTFFIYYLRYYHYNGFYNNIENKEILLNYSNCLNYDVNEFLKIQSFLKNKLKYKYSKAYLISNVKNMFDINQVKINNSYYLYDFSKENKMINLNNSFMLYYQIVFCIILFIFYYYFVIVTYIKLKNYINIIINNRIYIDLKYKTGYEDSLYSKFKLLKYNILESLIKFLLFYMNNFIKNSFKSYLDFIFVKDKKTFGYIEEINLEELYENYINFSFFNGYKIEEINKNYINLISKNYNFNLKFKENKKQYITNMLLLNYNFNKEEIFKYYKKYNNPLSILINIYCIKTNFKNDSIKLITFTEKYYEICEILNLNPIKLNNSDLTENYNLKIIFKPTIVLRKIKFVLEIDSNKNYYIDKNKIELLKKFKHYKFFENNIFSYFLYKLKIRLIENLFYILVHFNFIYLFIVFFNNNNDFKFYNFHFKYLYNWNIFRFDWIAEYINYFELTIIRIALLFSIYLYFWNLFISFLLHIILKLFKSNIFKFKFIWYFVKALIYIKNIIFFINLFIFLNYIFWLFLYNFYYNLINPNFYFLLTIIQFLVFSYVIYSIKKLFFFNFKSDLYLDYEKIFNSVIKNGLLKSLDDNVQNQERNISIKDSYKKEFIKRVGRLLKDFNVSTSKISFIKNLLLDKKDKIQKNYKNFVKSFRINDDYTELYYRLNYNYCNNLKNIVKGSNNYFFSIYLSNKKYNIDKSIYNKILNILIYIKKFNIKKWFWNLDFILINTLNQYEYSIIKNYLNIFIRNLYYEKTEYSLIDFNKNILNIFYLKNGKNSKFILYLLIKLLVPEYYIIKKNYSIFLNENLINYNFMEILNKKFPINIKNKLANYLNYLNIFWNINDFQFYECFENFKILNLKKIQNYEINENIVKDYYFYNYFTLYSYEDILYLIDFNNKFDLNIKDFLYFIKIIHIDYEFKNIETNEENLNLFKNNKLFKNIKSKMNLTSNELIGMFNMLKLNLNAKTFAIYLNKISKNNYDIKIILSIINLFFGKDKIDLKSLYQKFKIPYFYITCVINNISIKNEEIKNEIYDLDLIKIEELNNKNFTDKEILYSYITNLEDKNNTIIDLKNYINALYLKDINSLLLYFSKFINTIQKRKTLTYLSDLLQLLKQLYYVKKQKNFDHENILTLFKKINNDSIINCNHIFNLIISTNLNKKLDSIFHFLKIENNNNIISLIFNNLFNKIEHIKNKKNYLKKYFKNQNSNFKFLFKYMFFNKRRFNVDEIKIIIIFIKKIFQNWNFKRNLFYDWIKGISYYFFENKIKKLNLFFSKYFKNFYVELYIKLFYNNHNVVKNLNIFFDDIYKNENEYLDVILLYYFSINKINLNELKNLENFKNYIKGKKDINNTFYIIVNWINNINYLDENIMIHLNNSILIDCKQFVENYKLWKILFDKKCLKSLINITKKKITDLNDITNILNVDVKLFNFLYFLEIMSKSDLGLWDIIFKNKYFINYLNLLKIDVIEFKLLIKLIKKKYLNYEELNEICCYFNLNTYLNIKNIYDVFLIFENNYDNNTIKTINYIANSKLFFYLKLDNRFSWFYIKLFRGDIVHALNLYSIINYDKEYNYKDNIMFIFSLIGLKNLKINDIHSYENLYNSIKKCESKIKNFNPNNIENNKEYLLSHLYWKYKLDYKIYYEVNKYELIEKFEVEKSTFSFIFEIFLLNLKISNINLLEFISDWYLFEFIKHYYCKEYSKKDFIRFFDKIKIDYSKKFIEIIKSKIFKLNFFDIKNLLNENDRSYFKHWVNIWFKKLYKGDSELDLKEKYEYSPNKKFNYLINIICFERLKLNYENFNIQINKLFNKLKEKLFDSFLDFYITQDKVNTDHYWTSLFKNTEDIDYFYMSFINILFKEILNYLKSNKDYDKNNKYLLISNFNFLIWNINNKYLSDNNNLSRNNLENHKDKILNRINLILKNIEIILFFNNQNYIFRKLKYFELYSLSQGIFLNNKDLINYNSSLFSLEFQLYLKNKSFISKLLLIKNIKDEDSFKNYFNCIFKNFIIKDKRIFYFYTYTNKIKIYNFLLKKEFKYNLDSKIEYIYNNRSLNYEFNINLLIIELIINKYFEDLNINTEEENNLKKYYFGKTDNILFLQDVDSFIYLKMNKNNYMLNEILLKNQKVMDNFLNTYFDKFKEKIVYLLWDLYDLKNKKFNQDEFYIKIWDIIKDLKFNLKSHQNNIIEIFRYTYSYKYNDFIKFLNIIKYNISSNNYFLILKLPFWKRKYKKKYLKLILETTVVTLKNSCILKLWKILFFQHDDQYNIYVTNILLKLLSYMYKNNDFITHYINFKKDNTSEEEFFLSLIKDLNYEKINYLRLIVDFILKKQWNDYDLLLNLNKQSDLKNKEKNFIELTFGILLNQKVNKETLKFTCNLYNEKISFNFILDSLKLILNFKIKNIFKIFKFLLKYKYNEEFLDLINLYVNFNISQLDNINNNLISNILALTFFKINNKYKSILYYDNFYIGINNQIKENIIHINLKNFYLNINKNIIRNKQNIITGNTKKVYRIIFYKKISNVLSNNSIIQTQFLNLLFFNLKAFYVEGDKENNIENNIIKINNLLKYWQIEKNNNHDNFSNILDMVKMDFFNLSSDSEDFIKNIIFPIILLEVNLYNRKNNKNNVNILKKNILDFCVNLEKYDDNINISGSMKIYLKLFILLKQKQNNIDIIDYFLDNIIYKYFHIQDNLKFRNHLICLKKNLKPIYYLINNKDTLLCKKETLIQFYIDLMFKFLDFKEFIFIYLNNIMNFNIFIDIVEILKEDKLENFKLNKILTVINKYNLFINSQDETIVEYHYSFNKNLINKNKKVSENLYKILNIKYLYGVNFNKGFKLIFKRIGFKISKNRFFILCDSNKIKTIENFKKNIFVNNFDNLKYNIINWKINLDRNETLFLIVILIFRFIIYTCLNILINYVENYIFTQYLLLGILNLFVNLLLLYFWIIKYMINIKNKKLIKINFENFINFIWNKIYN